MHELLYAPGMTLIMTVVQDNDHRSLRVRTTERPSVVVDITDGTTIDLEELVEENESVSIMLHVIH